VNGERTVSKAGVSCGTQTRVSTRATCIRACDTDRSGYTLTVEYVFPTSCLYLYLCLCLRRLYLLFLTLFLLAHPFLAGPAAAPYAVYPTTGGRGQHDRWQCDLHLHSAAPTFSRPTGCSGIRYCSIFLVLLFTSSTY